MKLWVSNRLQVSNDAEDDSGSEVAPHSRWRHQRGKIRKKRVKVARDYKCNASFLGN